MSEPEILLAIIDIVSVMAHWCEEHLLLSGETRQAQARYQEFVLWLLASVGADQATARLLSLDANNEGWDAAQPELREFLGVAQSAEVGQLLAAGAQRIEQLRKYLEMTNVDQVKLPSVYIISQSLKPLCSGTLPTPSGRGAPFRLGC
jgi:hypothetical protein